MEQRYIKLKDQLDSFGYILPLVPDAVPLVEKLVSDLIQTTESLRRYMQLAKNAVEERDKLQLGAEPYKCDNAKLVKECNDLHLAFLQFKERHEHLQKDQKRKLALLERDKADLTSEIQKLKSNLSEFEAKTRYCRCPKLGTSRVQSKTSMSQGSTKFQTKATPKLRTNSDAQNQPQLNQLKNEIKRLKDEQIILFETNETLKNQMNNREKEIKRLNEMLQGGRPTDALNQDCCYKEVDIQVNKMQDEINNLRRSNAEFEDRLREAISKQHEAMKRALHLAERNKELEREMCDIDQMALAVEAECNSTVKCNTVKVNRLQDEIQETAMQLRSVEKEANDLKREKQELISDLEANKLEKKHLQKVLETTLEEKKRMTDKLNRFTIIENDLNNEIDRLVQLSGTQKCKIADLECRIMYGQGGPTDEIIKIPTREREASPSPTRGKKKKDRSKSPKSRKQHASKPGKSNKKTNKKTKRNKSPVSDSETESSVIVPKNSPVTERFMSDRSKLTMQEFESSVCCNPGYCSIHTSQQTTQRPIPSQNNQYQICPCCSCRLTTTSIPTQNITDTQRQQYIHGPKPFTKTTIPSAGSTNDIQRQAQISCTMDHIMAERDYYMKEYHKLLDKKQDKPGEADEQISYLRKQLQEYENAIRTLQHENKSLAQDKHNLMTRLETARDNTDFDAYSLTLKSSLKRLERENELLKDDVNKLEEDRNAVREKFKIISETQITDKGRCEQRLKEALDEIRKLEMERRELLQNKGTKSTSLKTVEDQCLQLSAQLKQCQIELNQQRVLYTQLKTLHEQTDKSLAESQSGCLQLERELHNAQDKNNELEKARQLLENELITLKNDLHHMKGSMGKIDAEKDSLLLSLDEKTESIVNIEQELKLREKAFKKLQDENNELKRKINASLQDTSSRDHIFRTMQTELNALKDELEGASRGKEMAIQENRRLQEDLLACTTDCKKSNTELEIARRQIEDLKRQLQTYVAEVKRTEDLISHKEIERSEMLDQFRSLSQEATALESSNHTLENEATQSRVQLSVALDHANELERRLEGQETLIKSYERQISDLTSQVASLELQLKAKCKVLERTDSELKTTRDLCVRLDGQKDSLLSQLTDKQSATVQMDKDVNRLRKEGEVLQNTLVQDRHTVESLEKLLRECRQENVEHHLLNQELQSELHKLKSKIEDLQVKFISATEQLDIYQEKAVEYAHQNKQLRREVANERFYRARDEDKRYPSL